MDAKKIIEKLKGESDRQRVSLYISKSLLEEFTHACKPASASKVLEELMRQFVSSSEAQPIKKKAVKKS